MFENFISDIIKNNQIIGAAISYLEMNADKFKGENAKMLFNDVQKAVAKAAKAAKA